MNNPTPTSIMTTNEIPHEDPTLWEQADQKVRENPIPAIIAAAAVGFGLGLLVRALEPERRAHPVRDCLDDTEDFLGNLFSPVRKQARHAGDVARHAGNVVREAVESAVERAQDVDIDPVSKWWKRLWS